MTHASHIDATASADSRRLPRRSSAALYYYFGFADRARTD